ncbi:hypothetical protein Tco_1089736 [Tanacetum coccineum]
MLLCKQKEAGIQLSAEQVDWRDDTDNEPEDQELEAHYIYMAKIQEVIPDAAVITPKLYIKITQEALIAVAGGIFLSKTPNQAYQLLEDKVLLTLDWAKNKKSKPSLKKIVGFADEGSSNSDTDKIMVRMDAMTMKMDAQYKEFQSRSKQPNLDHNDDDTPMSRKKAKFMQTFQRTCFYNDYRDRDLNRAKFDRLADKQNGRPSGSLPSNTQPNPKGMPNYGKFLKELISKISYAFLSDESSAMIQNKVPPKLGDPRKSNFDALLDEGSKILHSIEGTILEEKLFAEFDEFMAILNLTLENRHSKRSPLTLIIRSRRLLKNLLRILN